VDFQKTTAKGRESWEMAKKNNDFQSFKPYLLSIIEKKKQMLTYFDYEGGDYDYMLDQYEMGMTTAKYDEFFENIKGKLVPLISRINQSGKKINRSILEKDYDVNQQKDFTEKIKEILQVEDSKCYISESAHPFCSFFSTNDVRFTTRYLSDNLMGAILATIHEYGHGLYGLQIDSKYEMTTLLSEIGSGIHESQSRLLENHIGRSDGFWQVLYPKLQESFPDKLGQVTQGEFVEMMNASSASFIRVEADELTYPLHIVIRYELEKAIFDGTADLDSLETLWADKYEEYLGIRPETYSEGILQDIHWSSGYFGYFPTYALGSAFAAQFYHQMEKDIDVEKLLVNNEFCEIARWLRENIHQYGASKTFSQLLIDVTGEDFNPDYYVNHLVKKYEKLYFAEECD
jgi:carboxypeptidase Taq